jgi:hypothetical protein
VRWEPGLGEAFWADGGGEVGDSLAHETVVAGEEVVE